MNEASLLERVSDFLGPLGIVCCWDSLCKFNSFFVRNISIVLGATNIFNLIAHVVLGEMASVEPKVVILGILFGCGFGETFQQNQNKDSQFVFITEETQRAKQALGFQKGYNCYLVWETE